MQDLNENKKNINLEVVTSPSNSTIKYVKSLLSKKYREEYGQFIIEGEKIVLEALASDSKVEILIFSESYYHPLMMQAMERGIRCLKVKEQLFKQLSDTQSPQGVLAVINKRKYSLQQAVGQGSNFLVILDGIKDPGNLGTIIRTMDAAGGDGIVLINDCVDPYNPKSVRSTMGSILRVPIYRETNTDNIWRMLKGTGYHIAVSELSGTDVFEWQGGYDKIALVVGSESHGVSKEAAASAHSLIRIPMAGGAESLNASVAAGILIYEIFRKRVKKDR